MIKGAFYSDLLDAYFDEKADAEGAETEYMEIHKAELDLKEKVETLKNAAQEAYNEYTEASKKFTSAYDEYMKAKEEYRSTSGPYSRLDIDDLLNALFSK